MEKRDPSNGDEFPIGAEKPVAPPPYSPDPGQPINTQPQMVQQTVIIQAPEFGAEPMDAMCYTCQRTVRTEIKKSANIICCLLFGLWSCCCPGCQDVEHYCPNCKALLGRHKAV